MYHRVAGNGIVPSGTQGLWVTRRTFERHLRLLKNNFHVLTEAEYLGCLEKKDGFPSGSVLITFDDGWRDNYENAYPALKKEGLPAVVFPAVGFIGSSDLFWQDRLRRCLRELRNSGRGGRQAERLGRLCASAEVRRVIFAGERGFAAAMDSCVAAFKKKPYDEAERTISTLESFTGIGRTRPAGRNFLSWLELREMSENGVDIGSHGLRHAILTNIGDKGRLAREIAGSREILEFGLQRKVRIFSYPNGDHNEAVSAEVRRSGYAAAFGTAPGANFCTDDPYRMKRINIHEDMTDTMPMFLARIAGLW